MTRPVPLPGGSLEYAVLTALWDLGRTRARDVYERVGRPRSLVYTTINTVLERLHAKGLVSRHRAGRAFVYQARVKRETVERERARVTLAGLLASEPRPAAATLVDAVESIDPDLLDELAAAIARRRRRSPHGS